MKKFVLTLAIVIASFSLISIKAGVPDPTNSKEWGYEFEVHYFQDAGRNYCVGGAIYDTCAGTVYSWGSSGQYQTVVWSTFIPQCP